MHEIKSALLRRSEIKWLLVKKDVSKSYEYYMKSNIKKKQKTLVELELPLLISNGFTSNMDLCIY